MDQSLNLYQIFYEVSICRNFSAAAKKLYISQPAVSKSISRLESALHTSLFHRSSRGVTLTPEGELLFKHVEQAMLSLQTAEKQLEAALSRSVSVLSIGVSSTLCKYVLLPLLKSFIAENPHIKITISCQSTFETLSSLENGTIDIGLVGIPSDGNAEHTPVSYMPLKTIEDIFVASDTYLAPFQKARTAFSEPDPLLEKASFIMLDRENISRKHADRFLSEQQLSLQNLIEVSSMDLSIEFARAGLGIACVISDFVKEDLKSGTLCELKFKHRVPKRSIGFAFPDKKRVTDAMSTLIHYYRTFS